MSDTMRVAAVGALTFAAVWVIISLLFSGDISWVGGGVGAIAWFVAWTLAEQVRRHR
ncbi:hypothetical protein HC928_08105 [bacterium]|nr:hypothetical protein [bacterium]